MPPRGHTVLPSVRPFVRSFVTKPVKRNEPISMPDGINGPRGKGITINFGVGRSKVEVTRGRIF